MVLMDPKTLQRLFVALILLLMQITVSRAESEQEQAKQWLERMVRAARTLSYEGDFVYVRGQHVEAMHIIHSGDSEEERQRMYSLNGSLREVIVSNNQVTCLLSKQRVAIKDQSYRHSPFPISLPQELDKLENHYQFKILGEDRVADMETHVIAIQPRDRLRFGYRLWLENKTGIVLRSLLLDDEGHILEQLMFTELQLKPEIDAALLAPPKLLQESSPAQPIASAEKVTQSDWVLSKLPAGFTQVMDNRFSVSEGGRSTEHIVLTDGLATISVFLEPLNDAKPLLRGASQMGAMNAFGTVIADHQVMVVGEVPQATVQMIAASLRYTKETIAR